MSFDVPEYTAETAGLGALRLLEAIRESGLTPKFYQAGSSEMFGKIAEIPQRETTPFYPRSPYAAAKLYAYWIVVNYREAYDMYGMTAAHKTLFFNLRRLRARQRLVPGGGKGRKPLVKPPRANIGHPSHPRGISHAACMGKRIQKPLRPRFGPPVMPDAEAGQQLVVVDTWASRDVGVGRIFLRFRSANCHGESLSG